VAGRHENSFPLRSFVDRALVTLELLEISSLARDEQHHRAFREQNLWITLVKRVDDVVPLGSFQVHSHNVNSIIWLSDVLFVVDHFEFIIQEIDGDAILSGVVLLGSGQETLGEEES